MNTGVKDGDPECCSSVTVVMVQKAHTTQTKSSDGGDYHYTSSGQDADHLLTLLWQHDKQYFKFHSLCV